VHLIELFMVGAVRALDMGIEFRDFAGARTGELFLLTSQLELAANSLPPSTCKASPGKGNAPAKCRGNVPPRAK